VSGLRLLAVLAHPDDESLGVGGALAKYAAEGVETFVATATRGERGRLGLERPGAAVVGPVRERELRRAAAILGVSEVEFLDYLDGELDLVRPGEAVAKIARTIRRLRPQVVVTFPHDGNYGHPDHIAISQLTGAAIVEAAGADDRDGGRAHRVDKLYWMAWSEAQALAYARAFGDVVARVDGDVRRAGIWASWSITTLVDARPYWRQVWRAVQCHESQLAGYPRLGEADEALHESIWGLQEFYRVWSFVNGGRERETDLFAGLR
jgi:LmbE family N-acetylglucosaminyl deacetylase